MNTQAIMRDLLSRSFGLDKYEFIMNRYSLVDISWDEAFQRVFTGYYRVRRNAEWRQRYYSLFESEKRNPVSFGSILKELYVLTGQVECSFASKMLATLNPDYPIWDSKVLLALHIQPKEKSPEKRIEEAIRLYDDICGWYSHYLMSDQGLQALGSFNNWLPDYAWISDTKKIDCLIWAKPKSVKLDTI